MATLSIGGAKLADLALDFTLPGYSIELKVGCLWLRIVRFIYKFQPGGAHIEVDDSNLEEYLEKVLDFTLGAGIIRQVQAFREGWSYCKILEKTADYVTGFSQLFPIDDLAIFSPKELQLLLGDTEEDWSIESE
jgi:E3 ubiquitin-protein ligase TRIP12